MSVSFDPIHRSEQEQNEPEVDPRLNTSAKHKSRPPSMRTVPTFKEHKCNVAPYNATFNLPHHSSRKGANYLLFRYKGTPLTRGIWVSALTAAAWSGSRIAKLNSVVTWEEHSSPGVILPLGKTLHTLLELESIFEEQCRPAMCL